MAGRLVNDAKVGNAYLLNYQNYKDFHLKQNQKTTQYLVVSLKALKVEVSCQNTNPTNFQNHPRFVFLASRGL
jgi:hypothetical protein